MAERSIHTVGLRAVPVLSLFERTNEERWRAQVIELIEERDRRIDALETRLAALEAAP
jgi:hypothetical protein